MAEIRTNLRLPEELYEVVKRLADQDVRSINAQIVVLLREAVERRMVTPVKKPEVAQDG